MDIGKQEPQLGIFFLKIFEIKMSFIFSSNKFLQFVTQRKYRSQKFPKKKIGLYKMVKISSNSAWLGRKRKRENAQASNLEKF